MRNIIILLSGLLLGLISCQSGQHAPVPVLNVRTAMQNDNPISLKSDVESIKYIPLETNDSCLISNLLSL